MQNRLLISLPCPICEEFNERPIEAVVRGQGYRCGGCGGRVSVTPAERLRFRRLLLVRGAVGRELAAPAEEETAVGLG